jgi:NAD(P)H-dependent flavin oxidoreductase YrpB (nitropropane dioxygenase family)
MVLRYWIGADNGSRFVASEEAGCSRLHKEAVVSAGWNDTTRTLVISGRPLRVKRNEYIAAWEQQESKIKDLTDKGIIPMEDDMEEDNDVDFPFPMGVVAASIKDVKPARQIVEDMVMEAVEMMKLGQGYLGGGNGSRDSKL